MACHEVLFLKTEQQPLFPWMALLHSAVCRIGKAALGIAVEILFIGLKSL